MNDARPPLFRRRLQILLIEWSERLLARGHILGDPEWTGEHLLQATCITCGAALVIDGEQRTIAGPAREVDCEVGFLE